MSGLKKLEIIFTIPVITESGVLIIKRIVFSKVIFLLNRTQYSFDMLPIKTKFFIIFAEYF